jgi:cholesterol transport system auxiliary component
MPHRNKNLRLVSYTLLLLLGACSLGPTETTAPRTYFLNPEISWKNPHGYAERIGTAVLLITQPKAQAGFDTARMAYLLRPYEVNYYAFNQWADTPARLLHRIMVEGLDKTGQWSTVLQAPSAVPAQYRLDTDNLILEQQFFSRPSRVRLSVRAQIIDAKQQTILATRYFGVLEVAPTDDAYGAVLAANHAAEKFMIEIAAWLDMVFKDTK